MNVRLIQLVIGLACTLIFLAIAFDRVQLGAVSAALAGAQPVWIGAAMLSYAVNLALRAWRWQVILRPVAPIPYPTVARALLVGYGLNAVMPARLGELFRAEFFKKTFGLSRSTALRKRMNSRWLRRCMQRPITVPSSTLSAASSVVVPWPL